MESIIFNGLESATAQSCFVCGSWSRVQGGGLRLKGAGSRLQPELGLEVQLPWLVLPSSAHPAKPNGMTVSADVARDAPGLPPGSPSVRCAAVAAPGVHRASLWIRSRAGGITIALSSPDI